MNSPEKEKREQEIYESFFAESDHLKSLRPQKKTYDGPWRSFTEKEDAAEEYVIQAARYPVKESEYLADLEDAFTSGVEWKEKRGWKPSKEQIGALDYAYCELFKRKDVGHNILGPLQKLCDELKKLGVKEEPEYYQHFDPDC